MRVSRVTAALWALLCGAGAAHAQPGPCSGTLGQVEVVRCALTQSLDVKQARQQLTAVAGRRVAAGIWLPSNPTLAVNVAGRRTSRASPEGAQSLLNWYVTLSQEIEIAGQRSARLDEVDAEAAADVRRVAVVERETAATALDAYYELLAARDAVALATDLGEVADAMGVFALGRVKSALMAPVDADLLVAESARLGLLRADAERRAGSARALLATLLAKDPAVAFEIAGAIEPPRAPSETVSALTDRALLLRGEIAASEMERKMLTARLSVLRRSRAPNPTLSFIAQNDGFNELVLGGGLALPIPLPGPVGHSYAGEIAETRARIAQAETSVDLVRRRVRLEVAQAWAHVQARSGALRRFNPDVVARARADVRSLQDGLSSRQLSVREALFAERTLIEFLLGDIDARFTYALAVVELLRASGSPLPGAL